ncbi:MAG: SDR family NAD(P)-dependent oxidoreductase [Caulobacteraceae bacterium]
MKDLKGKVAVVTGGASGIGLSMAQAFAAEGMKLVIADIEEEALAQAVDGLKGRGCEAIGVRADVSKYEDVAVLADRTLAAFGKVHLVVNNAGVSITGPTWQMSLDDWRWVYGVNVWGVIHGIKAFTPIQLAQGEGGHVVITASEAAFLGIGQHSPYCSSKAAALSIGLSLYSELAAANSGIGVSVVCPGFVDTQIHRSWRNRPAEDRPWNEAEGRDPQRIAMADAFQSRGVPPEEIARVTLDAVKENRFYVFNTAHWREMIAGLRDATVGGENPPVYTWGPDQRPEAARSGPASGEARRP